MTLIFRRLLVIILLVVVVVFVCHVLDDDVSSPWSVEGVLYDRKISDVSKSVSVITVFVLNIKSIDRLTP